MRTVTTPQQTKTPRHSTAAAQPRPLTESDDDNEVQGNTIYCTKFYYRKHYTKREQ